MTDNKTAMRDSFGNTVFVNQYGEYEETFPEENIVNRDIEKDGFTIYYFVSCENEKHGYAELAYSTEKKVRALDFATEIYGEEIELTENISGEVFEVEVHNN